MADFDAIFERIKTATKTRTQIELAEVLDIRQSSISDAKRRNSIPSDWYMKLFERFGLNPDWLKKGTSPMYLRTDLGYTLLDGSHDAAGEESGRHKAQDAKNTLVAVYSSQLPVDGSDSSPLLLGRLAIPQSFYFPGLFVLRCETSGMEPHIRKGAFVGIDTSLRHVSSGEIYGIRLAYEGLALKRAYVDAQNSRLLLRSEHADIPELHLSLDGYGAHIVGRVSWVLQHV